ncbi:hypothetical protein [Shouchella patagoniensis]|uniref:hypothetical protein n=1 Tax=Shouchella patagoniensis TaxID=228576 RepID=UPI0011178BBC|nr:hypothetical protein [Shouchella patagoniensis]
MNGHFGQLRVWFKQLAKNERGGILFLTLLVLFAICSFFLWLLYDYERERMYLDQQANLLTLENGLQVGLMQIAHDPELESGEWHYPSMTVNMKKMNNRYLLNAKLTNGSERRANVYIDNNGKIIRYEEGV